MNLEMLTPLTSQPPCMPTQPLDPSRHIQHAYTNNHESNYRFPMARGLGGSWVVSYGAIIALAPGTGISTGGALEDADPIYLTCCGTAASQPSSSRESFPGLSEYQEPAWLASRLVIIEPLKKHSINEERIDLDFPEKSNRELQERGKARGTRRDVFVELSRYRGVFWRGKK